jgi:hypothetical protein
LAGFVDDHEVDHLGAAGEIGPRRQRAGCPAADVRHRSLDLLSAGQVLIIQGVRQFLERLSPGSEPLAYTFPHGGSRYPEPPAFGLLEAFHDDVGRVRMLERRQSLPCLIEGILCMHPVSDMLDGD